MASEQGKLPGGKFQPCCLLTGLWCDNPHGPGAQTNGQLGSGRPASWGRIEEVLPSCLLGLFHSLV